jgi:glycosyltransferase involved in cell wall biosynthesis
MWAIPVLQERNKLLGSAYALLHPIGFEEPFGLSVVEAMVCGTPVIAFKRGSMPELILDGKTGFLVHKIEEAVEAVNSIGFIDRRDCMEWATSTFSRAKNGGGLPGSLPEDPSLKYI